MPELPEVEIVASQLRKKIAGSVLSSVQIYRSEIIKPDAAGFQKCLPGKKVETIFRRGKFIAVVLDADLILWLHLGMTGQLVFRGEYTDPHVHMALGFRGSAERLFFRDVRRFGKIFLTPKTDENFPKGVRRLGPEPFELSASDFVGLYKARKGRIKSLLLNQQLMAGVGNIYADESLFRAAIDPRKRSFALSRKRLSLLHGMLCQTMQQAIEEGGSTIDDYRHVNGNSGRFQNLHQVYGREGEACRHCHAAIRRTLLAGRSSYFCPRCQK